jgi:hypothetical protein
MQTASGLTGPTGYTSDRTSCTISAAASQTVTVRFSPTAEQTYNGTLTVAGDQTSGTNTFAISGTGIRPRGSQTTFGAGQYLIGSRIASGRYYIDPLSGCYWERHSGLGGTVGASVRAAGETQRERDAFSELAAAPQRSHLPAALDGFPEP